MLPLVCPHCSQLAHASHEALSEGLVHRLSCPRCARTYFAYVRRRTWIPKALAWPWQLPMTYPASARLIGEPDDKPGSVADSIERLSASRSVVRIHLHEGQLTFTLLSTVMQDSGLQCPFVIRKWVQNDASATQVTEHHVLIWDLAQLDAWIHADPLTLLHAEAFAPLREACRSLLLPNPV
jgi:ribosomal protein S27AE